MNGKHLDEYIGDLNGLDWKKWYGGKPQYINPDIKKMWYNTIQTQLREGKWFVDVYDGHGNVILDRVRDAYMDNTYSELMSEQTFERIHELYVDWVKTDTYIHLQKMLEGIDPLTFNPTEVVDRDLLIKSSKRGNDIYRKRLKDRLNPIKTASKDKAKIKYRNATTNCIFITLTCDINRYDSYGEAWNNIGDDWNKFITNVRNNFGSVSYFRVFEAYKNHYPHIHAILIFNEHEFPMFEYNGRHRIKPKGVFNDYWHSHIDVEGIRSITGSINYISKYLTKSMGDVSNADTLTLLWFFRKRSYAISREFLSDLIPVHLHNSKIEYLITFATFINYRYRGQVLADFIGRYENFIICDEHLTKKCNFYHDMMNL